VVLWLRRARVRLHHGVHVLTGAVIIVSPETAASLEAAFAKVVAALSALNLPHFDPIDEAALAAHTDWFGGRGPAAPAELRAIDLRQLHARPRHEAREHRQQARRPHARGWGAR
jgi:hypothetical protein